MNISEMNVRISIKKKTSWQMDAAGNHTESRMDYYDCWAKAVDKTGKEEQAGGVTSEKGRMDFTVRYSSKVAVVNTTQYFIMIGKRRYNIIHIDEMDNRKRFRKFITEYDGKD